ncbi:uracil-xanthine permease family protein [Alkaliphilus peptidifermentans]|uniref:Nucleobase:cation symporter-2, NCS2 family n=1 Tax=Alkaliphilus peptidifermentans DSM 18978 TaxID=1120976 RepID=A0A1G5JXI5_9FIRM|nr:nucleobase:cation symporter-2 family protein [Alkaliphilus peptidifermentans]SCY92621.1 nucleobase:cation symporter-2, NCS2 family [Alkaliphilus peptidifermentans DSM 18978]
MVEKTTKNMSVFDLNGVPTLGKATPLGLQHVLAMIVGNVTPAIIVAGVVGLNSADRTLLVQCAMFIAGIATLLQLYPIGKVGSGLPVIMGVSFAYVPSLIAIGSQYGIAGIFGAQLIGGIAAIIVGIFIKPIRKYFPPLVAGTVVFTIGLSLYPIAINYIAGGVGSPTYGAFINWGIAIITLSVVLFCNQFTKGYTKLASILMGIVVGYVISITFGIVDFTPVREAAWFAVPKPLHFGIEFYPSAIITMIIMYIVNSVQAVGDLSATTVGGMGREVTDKELSGGIIGNGLSSVIASLFGGLPTATYSQNVGIVAMTKVVSRFVLALAAGFILLGGFVPKFGAVMTTIPQSVLGGATITVFAMITMTGIKLIIQDELSGRNITIVGLAVALGMGITQVPQSLALFPSWVMMVFGSSAVVIATVVVFTLNLILPQKTLADEQKEREEMELKG